MSQYQPLPVSGYKPQNADRVDQVNRHKEVEERVLRMLDDLAAYPDVDPRWFAVGRRHIEQGFMEINRAVFQPARVTLPEDGR